jgi:ADP-ribosyl-[dinitrogen reductase] hydrolase
VSTTPETLMTDPDPLGRACGALVGLAVGDAVGTTVEFMPRGTFPPVADMAGGGPFDLQPGQWTDDTSMALCLAESLLADPGLSPRDLMDRFDRWVTEGHNSSTGRCFDVGVTTRAAIERYRRTGDPLAGDPGPRAAGNGSVMRLAPVAVRWWRDPEMAEAVARSQSLTTHAAPEAVDACALLARMLVGAIAGGGREAVLEPRVAPGWRPAIRAIAAGAWRGKAEADIRSTGYVVHTLEAAVWAFAGSTCFEGAVLRAVNLCDDADTVGAVAGQIAGAVYGLGGVPERWADCLYRRRDILDLGRRLFTNSLLRS